MEQLLHEAFERAAALPPAEQKGLARFLLAELDSERPWAKVGHPVDRVAGILDGTDFDIDEYIEEIRGR